MKTNENVISDPSVSPRATEPRIFSEICGAMKDFELNIVVGKGMGARSMPLAVKPFTCIGSAEKVL
jgi:Holliday junction resolvasome RuvABC ATP-dependent DNA helicase subunit